MIDVTLLGTSALIPLPERALTAALLTCGGRSILFDCGEGTQTAARRAGVSLMKADMIALTHYHGDHIFGLPGLMQTMSSLGRADALTITGPEGLEDALSPILAMTGWISYEVRLLTLPGEGLSLRRLNRHWPELARLEAFGTFHRVPSQGYRFTLGRMGAFRPERARVLGVPTAQWRLLQAGQSVRVGDATVAPEMVLREPRKGLKFVFSGDTAPCDSLVRAAEGADLLICEATYGEDGQAALAARHGHMNFAQAAAVGAKAHVRRLWLTHYSQMIENPLDCLPNAAAIFPDARCGEDGMRVTLRFEQDG